MQEQKQRPVWNRQAAEDLTGKKQPELRGLEMLKVLQVTENSDAVRLGQLEKAGATSDLAVGGWVDLLAHLEKRGLGLEESLGLNHTSWAGLQSLREDH